MGIGLEADAVRRRLHPEGVVSYAMEGAVDCGASAPGVSGESVDDALGRIFDAVAETVELGGTGVRLACGIQGSGGEEILRLEAVLRGIRRRFPSIWIEGLSAPELRTLAAGCGLGLQDAITRLLEAGLDSITGDGVSLAGLDGGRELCSVGEWREVHRVAHELGIRTAAAVAFGGSETLEQRVDFLAAVRELQKETGGFTAFAPRAAEAPGGRALDGVTAIERLKTLAIARMFLDTIENVQASAAGEGLKVLQMGLRFGANDAGPVGPESHGGSEEDVRRIIRDAGFRPAQRDIAYRAMMLS